MALIRLNKFVAHSGVCSRRQAVELIKAGKVLLNGKVLENPFIEIDPDTDVITYEGKTLRAAQKSIYLLLNKPKGTISTVKDEKGRKTVIDLIGKEVSQRIYPVGRLDRDTTGLLLLTNDGELAQRLTHPSFEMSKVYEVTAEKEISDAHISQLRAGLTLEDGAIKPDAVNRVVKGSTKQIAIRLHSGRNRIVRRMMEHLGYRVVHLDRVRYAGLTKKNIARGKYRQLTDLEVRNLKYLNP